MLSGVAELEVDVIGRLCNNLLEYDVSIAVIVRTFVACMFRIVTYLWIGMFFIFT